MEFDNKHYLIGRTTHWQDCKLTIGSTMRTDAHGKLMVRFPWTPDWCVLNGYSYLISRDWCVGLSIDIQLAAWDGPKPLYIAWLLYLYWVGWKAGWCLRACLRGYFEAGLIVCLDTCLDSRWRACMRLCPRCWFRAWLREPCLRAAHETAALWEEYSFPREDLGGRKLWVRRTFG